MLKRPIGSAPVAGSALMTPTKYACASSVSPRFPEYLVSVPPGPHRRSSKSSTASPAALSSFAAASKSGCFAGAMAATVFLARAPVEADMTSVKPAYEYRQSSPADVLRSTVLRLAEEYASRPQVMRPQVMRPKHLVASALATGSPREVLSNLAIECRQAVGKRTCRILRKRFVAPEA